MAIDADSAGVMTTPADLEEFDSPQDTAYPEGVAHDQDTEQSASGPREQNHRLWSVLLHPLTFGLTVVVALAVLVGWLGLQSHQSRQTQRENAAFLQAARQAALNLTTIDWHHADADVKRIMDSASGQFYDEFNQRSQPFVDVVKRAQSVSTGTVTESALESESSAEAQALVAVSVKASSSVGNEPLPRAWRMRISVQKIDGQMKISRVEFVP